jgi:hypothetical protein
MEPAVAIVALALAFVVSVSANTPDTDEPVGLTFSNHSSVGPLPR